MCLKQITSYEVLTSQELLKRYPDLWVGYDKRNLEKIASGKKKTQSRKSAERLEKLRKGS